MKSLSISSIILLIIAFAVYASTGIFSKLASMQDFLSMDYCFFLGAIVLMLAIYAILWQIILKSTPLAQAFLFKSSTVIFALIFASFLFDEHVSLQNLVGASFIIAGIVVNSFNYSS